MTNITRLHEEASLSSQTQKGFTLIEILVSLGLLGVVSLFGAKLIGDINTNAKKNRADIELTNFLSQANQILFDPRSCDYHRREYDYTGEPIPVLNVGDSVTRPYLWTKHAHDKIDEFEGGTFDPTDSAQLEALGEDASLLYNGMTVGPSELLRIDGDFVLTRKSDAILEVLINFARNYGGSGGLQSLQRRVMVFMGFDGSNTAFQHCFDMNMGAGGSAYDLTCAHNVGRGVFIEGSNLDGDPTCERVNLTVASECLLGQFMTAIGMGGADHLCAPGAAVPYGDVSCAGTDQFLMAFNSDGTPQCVDMGITWFRTPFMGTTGTCSLSADHAQLGLVDIGGGVMNIQGDCP